MSPGRAVRGPRAAGGPGGARGGHLRVRGARAGALRRVRTPRTLHAVSNVTIVLSIFSQVYIIHSLVTHIFFLLSKKYALIKYLNFLHD